MIASSTNTLHQLGNGVVMDVHWNIWTLLVLMFLLYASYEIGKTEIETDKSLKINFMVLEKNISSV